MVFTTHRAVFFSGNFVLAKAEESVETVISQLAGALSKLKKTLAEVSAPAQGNEKEQ